MHEPASDYMLLKCVCMSILSADMFSYTNNLIIQLQGWYRETVSWIISKILIERSRETWENEFKHELIAKDTCPKFESKRTPPHKPSENAAI